MTPEQLADLVSKIDRVGTLTTVVLIIEVLLGIALVIAHARIARNQVATAELLEQAVAKLESELPKL